MSDRAFEKEIDRLQRITAELVHVRDVLLQPVPGDGASTGAHAHHAAMAARYAAWCRSRQASPLLSMTRLMELAMAAGDPATNDPAVAELLDKTSYAPPKGDAHAA